MKGLRKSVKELIGTPGKRILFKGLNLLEMNTVSGIDEWFRQRLKDRQLLAGLRIVNHKDLLH